MRHLLLAVIGLFLSFLSFSQQREIKEGDAYFKLYQYHEAAQKYQQAVVLAPNNYYAKYRLAESYFYHFDYAEAEKYYAEVADKKPNDFPLVRYKYAATLRAEGEYQKAKNNLEIFLEKYVNNSVTFRLQNKSINNRTNF